jgi:hypothetical protein
LPAVRINKPSDSPPRSYPYSEASALHRGDVNKDVIAAALRLDESITLGRITLLLTLPTAPSAVTRNGRPHQHSSRYLRDKR